MTASRDPAADPTPLDLASFYIEELKYGDRPRRIEGATKDEIVADLQQLLDDSWYVRMTGQQLRDALEYYARTFVRDFGAPVVLARSIWVDGLMHGIALHAGLEGELRSGAAVKEASSDG